MKQILIRLLLTAGAVSAVSAARADETAIQLAPGEGLEVVEQNCGACHSLDYIPMNSPFLDEKGWTAEVTKMINAYGAPVSEDDAQKIIAYLVEHYGPQ